MTEEERRSGRDRRAVPPNVCSVPCEPIDKKLTAIQKCATGKVTNKLYYWSFGGLCFFVIIIIGGGQWKMLDKINKIDTNVQVMNATVQSTDYLLKTHIDDAKHLFERHDDRLRTLENRSHNP